MSADAGRPRAWKGDAGQHGDGGRLAGPVRAKQAKDFPLVYGKADTFYRAEFAEFFNQVFDFEYFGHDFHSLRENQQL